MLRMSTWHPISLRSALAIAPLTIVLLLVACREYRPHEIVSSTEFNGRNRSYASGSLHDFMSALGAARGEMIETHAAGDFKRSAELALSCVRETYAERERNECRALLMAAVLLSPDSKAACDAISNLIALSGNGDSLPEPCNLVESDEARLELVIEPSTFVLPRDSSDLRLVAMDESQRIVVDTGSTLSSFVRGGRAARARAKMLRTSVIGAIGNLTEASVGVASTRGGTDKFVFLRPEPDIFPFMLGLSDLRERRVLRWTRTAVEIDAGESPFGRPSERFALKYVFGAIAFEAEVHDKRALVCVDTGANITLVRRWILVDAVAHGSSFKRQTLQTADSPVGIDGWSMDSLMLHSGESRLPVRNFFASRDGAIGLPCDIAIGMQDLDGFDAVELDFSKLELRLFSDPPP